MHRRIKHVGLFLQSISVNIEATTGYGGAQGSGTIVLAKVGDKPVAWVLTAAHVVRELREVKTSIKDGDEKKTVRYRDAQIVQEVPNSNNSRVVGDSRFDAKVINVDYIRDIALLRVRALGKFSTGAAFYLKDEVPTVGTELYHCGAPGGKELGGTSTLTAGIVSRTGVRIPEFGGSDDGVFDQTDTSGLPGSSGGLIALRSTGEWIGMITLGLKTGDSFHWFVPVRAVRTWAKEINAEWLLDPKAAAPSEADVDKIPIELSSPNGGGGVSIPANHPVSSTSMNRMLLDLYE